MPKTSYRTSKFGESVIRGMTRLANECGAINLSQGYPDFDPPEVVLQAAERAARMDPHQYAVTWGAPNFRAALRASSHASWEWRLIRKRMWRSPAVALKQ